MEKKAAIELMKSRGYSHVSDAGNETWAGFSKDINGIRMHATVYFEQESVTLTGGVLKMMCELTCKKFALEHKNFSDFENILYLYAKVCSEIDVLVDNEGIIKKAFGEAVKAIKNEPVEEVKNTLEERKKKFMKEVQDIGKSKGYPPAMCKKFFEYWSETNTNGKKMRWEIQKAKSGVFNTKGRMVTWAGKEGDFNATFKDRDEKKAAKQNEQLKEKKQMVDPKTLF